MNVLLLVTLALACAEGDVLAIPPVGAPSPIGVTPDAVVWKPGPASLPAGTQSVVLEGDPTKPGLVTMRLKIAKGFRLAKHTHPADERVTVLSGAMKVTYLDASGATTSARTFPAGSFYVTPKGMPHTVAVDEETVMQITVQGPWGIAYLDAKDDPRK